MKKATRQFSRPAVAKWEIAFAACLFSLACFGIVRADNHADELYRLFQVDLPSADVAISFDASLSMKFHQYGEVRQAVIDFAPTLTDKETLQLRIFGDTVSSPLEGKGQDVAPSVSAYLPAEPFFYHTDLGLAILKAIEFLEREGSSKVQAFFLLTDGLHDPPSESPYSRDFNDQNWRALQLRAQALCKRHKVFVYGFGLGQQTDIAVLRKVFPAQNVEVIVGNASHVAYALRQVRERLSITQLRQAIEQELAQHAVEVSVPQSTIDGEFSSFKVPLIVRNPYRLPIVIEQIKIVSSPGSNPAVSCALYKSPLNSTVGPGAEWRGTVKGDLQAASHPWRLGKKQDTYAADFDIIPVVRFQDEDALADMDLANTTPTLPASRVLDVSLTVTYGTSYWTIVIGGFLVFTPIAVFAAGRHRIKKRSEAVQQRQSERRRLAGKLQLWRAPGDEPTEDGLDLEGFAARSVEALVTPDGNLDIAALDSLTEHTSDVTVVQIHAELIGASPDDAESGKVEFVIQSAGAHQLRYESGNEWREASELTLCDNDVLELDRRWRLRYVNNNLRTRAEIESATTDDGGVYV